MVVVAGVVTSIGDVGGVSKSTPTHRFMMSWFGRPLCSLASAWIEMSTDSKSASEGEGKSASEGKGECKSVSEGEGNGASAGEGKGASEGDGKGASEGEGKGEGEVKVT